MSETLGTSTEVKNETLDQAAYEAEMIAKADEAEAKSLEKDADQFTEEADTLYAGKYKSPEDLEKAYKELESKLGKQNEEPTETKEETEDNTTEVPTTQEEAEELVSSKGIDFSELNTEFADKGELSAETYDRLSKAGITKETVDAYIAGQQALAQQNIAKMQESVGGESNYNDMIAWAAENLTDSEKTAFNNMVSNEASADFAIKGLFARYKAEAEPNLLDGSSRNVGQTGYMSHREMTREMADPRYKTDPAFRKMVEMKVARSKF